MLIERLFIISATPSGCNIFNDFYEISRTCHAIWLNRKRSSDVMPDALGALDEHESGGRVLAERVSAERPHG